MCAQATAAVTSWPETIDEILDGDLTVALATVTPAKGVVVVPITNFGVRDRGAGTITAVNSSVSVPRKLERIRRNPRVALAYHTREHSDSARPEYVLVQGTASLTEPHPRYMDTIGESFERRGGYELVGRGRFWNWWMRIYHLRVGIEVQVEREVVWPDLNCSGPPHVIGPSLPTEDATPQRPPEKGTMPRINHRRAARRASRLPYSLLGWVGTDGFPFVVPARIAGSDAQGIALELPDGAKPVAGGPGSQPTGGRNDVGIGQRIHTGWLEAAPGARRAVYAPHTKAGFTIPRSKLAFRIGAGAGTRWRMRAAGKRPVGLRRF